MLVGDELTYDLTLAAREGKIPRTFGRDEEIAGLIQMLGSDEGKCILLVGQRGIGKRAVVQGLVTKAAEDSGLSHLSILELNVGKLFLETVRWSELAEELLDSLKSHPSQMLYLDPCVPFMGASEPGSALIRLYSEAIRADEIRVIATLDLADYERLRASDSWVFETFREMKIEALTKEAVSNVLESIRPEIEKNFGLALSSGAVDAAIDLSRKYLSDRGLPGIAVEVLGKACERYSRKLNTTDMEDEWLDSSSMHMMGEKVSSYDVKRVVEEMAALDIDADQVATWTRKVRSRLQELVFAQDEANQRAAEAVAKAILQLGTAGRPCGALLFIGPRGIGKTHAARTLALGVASSEKDVSVFDMADYVSDADLRRLFGYTPSTGGRVRGSELYEAVRGAPIAFVILEHMEQAHRDAFDSLQQILDTGLLRDREGGKIKFRRCVLIFLASYPDSLKPPRDMSSEKIFGLASDMVPERMCNSVGAIIPFVPLRRKKAEEFIRRRVDRYVETLEGQEVELRVDSSVFDLVAKPGAGRFTGVPELIIAIRRTIRKPIYDALRANDPRAGLRLHARTEEGRVVVDVTRPK